MTNTFIIKVASRCNLNCSYCYMYNMGDNTYLKQPKFMTGETIDAFAKKLSNYCQLYSLNEVYVSFHGGEPLLAKKEFYRYVVNKIRSVIKHTEIFFIMQTNGTLLDDEWCLLFKELDIQVGISIDGPEEFHDKYRIYHNDEGSFNQVIAGIEKRNFYGKGGLISVINIQIPPLQLYNLFKSLDGQRINILLPDGHYENMPEGFEHFSDLRQTPYADWLIELYQHWKEDKNTRPNITFFSNIVSILLGYNKGDELIGKGKNGAICIETDGAIEVVDPLRICGNGFTKNKLNIKTNELSEIEQLPLFDLFYNSHHILSNKCTNCQLKDICGGGYLPHRYSQYNGFDNASIYCKDLAKIISYIQNDIIESFPDNLINELGLEPMDYERCLTDLLVIDQTISEESRVLLRSFKKDFIILNN